MGRYLNSSTPYALYQGETNQPYFVDKSLLLAELFPVLDAGNQHICITRPRRFGKTIMANMIAAFLSKKVDSDSIFSRLKITSNLKYKEYRNKYNVISIDFSKISRSCDSYSDYIGKIETTLIRDLKKEYPQIEVYEDDSAADVLETIFEECNQERFVFVLDEWDFIFHKDFINEENKKQYIQFLSNLLKDRPYVQMTYMTGILPIAKYSDGSELNMFDEYDMACKEKYSEYFGFLDEEVDQLYDIYKKITKNPKILRSELKEWYDGYRFGNVDVYCPWDVINHVDRIKDDQGARPEAYWINTSGNELVKRFVDKAGKTTRNEIERLIAGEVIEKQIRLDLTYDEIDSSIDNLWSVLFTTGYLTYTGIGEDGTYRLLIPNKEVREVFRLQIQEWFKRSIFSNTEQLQSFWKAFEEGNTEIMEKYLNKVLSNSVSVFDTKARNEEKESSYHNLLLGILTGNAGWLVKSNVEAGEGFADIIVETDDPDAGVVVELKYVKEFREMEQACRKALEQIRGRRYQEYLQNDDRQDILLYGITFCKKRCRVVAEKMKAPGI